MLERMFPIPDALAVRLVVKTFSHDFGAYREVCVLYDTDDHAACAYALRAESKAPAHWDARAQAELAWYEERARYRCLAANGQLPAHQIPEMYRQHTPPDDLPLGNATPREPAAARS
jgi:hypothetical protein